MTAAQFVLKEVLIALLLVAFGIFALPAMVYGVGQLIVGEYEAGLLGLYDAIADQLVAGHRYAWLMILSPYLCVQLVRFWFWLRRPRPVVN